MPKHPLYQSITVRSCAVALVLATAAGCANTPRSSQEAASVLSRPGQARETYFAAIEAARTLGPSPETTAALRRMVAADGYAIDARVMAFDLLLETDRKALLNAMDAPPNHPDRVSSAELARMLTEEGYGVHFKGIERHRNRVCRCFTGSSRVAPESP